MEDQCNYAHVKSLWHHLLVTPTRSVEHITIVLNVTAHTVYGRISDDEMRSDSLPQDILPVLAVNGVMSTPSALRSLPS